MTGELKLPGFTYFPWFLKVMQSQYQFSAASSITTHVTGTGSYNIEHQILLRRNQVYKNRFGVWFDGVPDSWQADNTIGCAWDRYLVMTAPVNCA